MSMQILTVRQLWEMFGVFGIYCVMTFFLPAILLYPKVRYMRFPARFMAYQAAGNFFIIYLVLVLRFFHICNRLALCICTAAIIVSCAFAVFVKHTFWKAPSEGERRSAVLSGGYADRVWGNLAEILLLFVVAAILLAAYDGNPAGDYSYRRSDFTAYHSWVQNIDDDAGAVEGIRPLWYYSMVYYMHMVFGLDEFILFRSFWIVKTLLLFLLLLAFLRLFCRFRYTAYTGIAFYAFAVFFGHDPYTGEVRYRFEESGMLFLWPAAAFLFLFFERKKQELAEEKAAQEMTQVMEESEAAEGRRIYLLDDLLAETAEKEAADLTEPEETAISDEEAEQAVFIMEENEQDGTISIKECPLDGTVSVQDSSIEELAEHAAEDIPLLDIGQQADRQADRSTRYADRYLVFFALAFGMALAQSAGQAAAAVVMCIAVCTGYCFRLFRVPYLWRVLLAGVSALLLPAASIFLIGYRGTLFEGIADRYAMGGKVHLTWKVIYAYLFPADGSWQSLMFLASVGLLFLLALIRFLMSQTDHAARMLSVALYMTGLMLFSAASGTGALKPGNEWGCIRLYYAFSLVIVWGMCVDGILPGCFLRRK